MLLVIITVDELDFELCFEERDQMNSQCVEDGY